MKFDIIKRLREPPFGTETSERLLMAQAADEIDTLRAENERLSKVVRSCDWWWPADDTSSDTCQDGPYEILSETDAGAVVAIARGGVVETTFHAWLPPADDADSDDDFLVEASNEAEVRRLVEAEKARRAALSEDAQ